MPERLNILYVLADQQALIGKLLGVLKRTHWEDSTIVIFSSDHGDGHGQHQWNQESTLYEETPRAPLLIADPGETTSLAVGSRNCRVLGEYRRRVIEATRSGELMGAWEPWMPGTPYEAPTAVMEGREPAGKRT